MQEKSLSAISVNLAREKRSKKDGTKYEHPTRKKCNLYIYTVINKSPCDHTNAEKERERRNSPQRKPEGKFL